MIYIAAPFGNYIHPRNTTSVMGTFTVEPRRGLLLQIIKTLRYSFRDKCWYNQLGLRNPGIDKGYDKWLNADHSQNRKIISVTAIEPGDWKILHMITPKNVPLELNISCPNIAHFADYTKELYYLADRNPIVKISPLTKETDIQNLIAQGFTHFHASNTLPTSKGARSGAILHTYTTQLIRTIKTLLPSAVVIAGGGIFSHLDVREYHAAGADHFSLGTVCFNPLKLRRILNHYASY